MNKEVYVAILDSGCSFKTYEKFSLSFDEKQKPVFKEQKNINFLHGDVIANIIKQKGVNIYDIQIFNEKLLTTPLHIYYALKYLLDKKIDVISLSLGFNTNYKEIEEVCNELLKKGVTIVASYPRRSKVHTYPASYEKVIKVTSEGMCKDDKVVSLEASKLFFGANPFSNKKEVAGSSVAVAKFTSEYCAYLQKGFTKEQILKEFEKRRVNEPY
ncbi:S8 family serine peptidase [Halarcobacter sp.]|uniref:subtilisin-like serine protease QhpE n=1 Tax=Halarcobacter sp. TaxID=2321133 RepID=UPI002AA906D0|nr:S8 family serine peptidase [Halarcobacter sp.]